MKSVFRLISLSLGALFAVAPCSGAPPTHLERLRLLPPVLIQGEAGWPISERMRHYKVEAVSVAVVKDFRVLWTEALGLADREAGIPATTETLFQAGSISKPVAAAGVLRRAEKGELDLGRNVNEYLKSWKLPENALTAKHRVTLELLLSHSAGTTVHGFPGYAAGEPVPTLPEVLDGLPPANTDAVRVDLEPGSQFRYSGGGITITQLLQTDTTGRPFPDLLRELVLQPAGMTHSTYEQPLPPEKLRFAAAGYRTDGSLLPGKRHTYPEMAAAGLWTTSEDLARFGIAVARSLRGEEKSLLSKEMAARMTTPFLKGGPTGLGLFITKKGSQVYVGHDGSDEGFQAMLLIHPDKGYGAAIMANSDEGISLGEEILRAIAREYGWAGYLPEPLETVRISAADARALAGRYGINAVEGFRVIEDGGRLVGKPSFGDEYELLAVSRDLLVRRDRETRYQVEWFHGAVLGMTILADNKRNPARRLKAGERLPAELLAAGETDTATAAYRKVLAEKPEDAGIAESRLNQVGYWLANRGEFSKAIAMLRLNTELRPSSTNAYDSLAEVYLTSGDRARALETYRKVLEVLPRDTKTDPAFKDRLRRNAESKVRELSP